MIIGWSNMFGHRAEIGLYGQMVLNSCNENFSDALLLYLANSLTYLSIMEKRYDFLVIGSGLGGISFALKVAAHGKVALVTKTTLEETNTRYAQGGIAAVTYEPDSYEKHVEDTLIAGDGLCDERIVRLVVKEAPGQIEELISWGTRFDKEKDGTYSLGREGGHSEYRILHHKDNTGAEIQRALSGKVRAHPNIDLYENHFAVDLITRHHKGMKVKRQFDDIECFGAYIMNLENNKIATLVLDLRPLQSSLQSLQVLEDRQFPVNLINLECFGLRNCNLGLTGCALFYHLLGLVTLVRLRIIRHWLFGSRIVFGHYFFSSVPSVFSSSSTTSASTTSSAFAAGSSGASAAAA